MLCHSKMTIPFLVSLGSNCLTQLSSPYHIRQPLAVSIRWLPYCGGCRTRHSAKGYDWHCNLPMNGLHGTSRHRPHTAVWISKARCCPRWIGYIRHPCRPKEKIPCSTECRSSGGGYAPAARPSVLPDFGQTILSSHATDAESGSMR